MTWFEVVFEVTFAVVIVLAPYNITYQIDVKANPIFSFPYHHKHALFGQENNKL